MKKLIFVSIIMLMAIHLIMAQVPEAFKYQAVIRDTLGNTLSGQLISMKISILKGDINGETVYSEIHDAWTNKLGLIGLEIGNGIAITGDFSEILWGEDKYFVQTEIDLSGGMDYQFLGISQLLAVPYALYAETSGNSLWSESEEGIFYNEGKVGIGTNTPSGMLGIQIPAISGAILEREVLLKGQVSDAPEDFFRITNHTKFNNQFIPNLWGHHVSDARLAMCMIGSINEETDYGDSAVIVFSARTFDGAWGNGQVRNRALFEWWNLGEAKMTMLANGNLGIGTTTPSGMLGIQAPGAIQQQEVLLKGQVSDAPEDFIKVLNGTKFDNQFVPNIWGHHASGNRYALGFTGSINEENDYGDFAVTSFNSRIYNGGWEPGQVVNRPLFVWRNLSEAKMTMLANGNLGIGTTTPSGMLGIQAPAIAGTIQQREVILKGQISDAPEDFIKIGNGTRFNNQFIPWLWGHHVSDNRQAICMIGTINEETDYGDNAVIVFSSRIFDGEWEWGQIMNRPLFDWRNLSETKMTMLANGNLGIGTTTPQRTLHVNDVIRLEPRATPPDNPMEGDMFMDSNDHVLKVFDGTEWKTCW